MFSVRSRDISLSRFLIRSDCVEFALLSINRRHMNGSKHIPCNFSVLSNETAFYCSYLGIMIRETGSIDLRASIASTEGGGSFRRAM